MPRRFIAALLLFVLIASPTVQRTFAEIAPPGGEPIQVKGGPLLLAGRVYRSGHHSSSPHLIVVLHGDAPGTNPSYQYVFARRAADALDNSVVAALLRPGYADGQGLASQGQVGRKLGDNYTRDRIAAIADAAQTLMRRYRAADLTMAGHSGGAAISADLLGLYPHLASRALLVSCPCDVPAFRWSMMKLQWNPWWLLPESSISPQDEVAAIPNDTVIRMVVGADDPVTPEPLTLAFADALKAKGDDVEVTVLPDRGHEIFLEPQVLHELQRLMAMTPGDSAGP
jgi:predicted esterase